MPEYKPFVSTADCGSALLLQPIGLQRLGCTYSLTRACVPSVQRHLFVQHMQAARWMKIHIRDAQHECLLDFTDHLMNPGVMSGWLHRTPAAWQEYYTLSIWYSVIASRAVEHPNNPSSNNTEASASTDMPCSTVGMPAVSPMQAVMTAHASRMQRMASTELGPRMGRHRRSPGWHCGSPQAWQSRTSRWPAWPAA